MRKLVFLLVLLVPVAAWSQEEAPESSLESTLLGDYHDGSQCPHVHHMMLYDAEGFRIFPGVNDNQPFSLKVTCGQCHDVGTIAKGWHFSTQPAVGTGRPSQPWIYWDAGLATQIPLTLRPWPGLFEPNQIGLSDWEFIQAFGRQLTGGQIQSPSEDGPAVPGERWDASGDFEINCLACHNAASGHDQSQAADQTGLQNYAWTPAATSELAHVSGSVKRQARTWEDGALGRDGPKVTYDESRFFADNHVFMDIRADVPNERCLFCHSNALVSSHGIHSDQDVHLAAGMACVDCHRNGLDHAMVRGYENEAADTNDPARATLSCRGCHLGSEDVAKPDGGRLAAPYPLHKGIPAIHFDVMSCTACHSGPWPEMQTAALKTSRAHALGTKRVNRTDETLPHIQNPVFCVSTDGKLAPHRLVWPAYWGYLDGESVLPVTLAQVREAVQGILPQGYAITSSSWPEVTDEQIRGVLERLCVPDGATAVYISGGKLHRVEGGTLKSQAHAAAAAVTWPLAHDVRPAQQSLGVRNCQDCHDTETGMLFGQVAVDGPLTDPNESVTMAQFHGLDPQFNTLFAQSFVFRPWMKLVSSLACLLVLGVLATYALRAFHAVGRGSADS